MKFSTINGSSTGSRIVTPGERGEVHLPGSPPAATATTFLEGSHG